MLRPLKRDELRAHIDWAYGLALDMEKSSYPTYADGIKTKAEFVSAAQRSFEREHEEILLFEQDGRPAGWIHYYALPEDFYISFRAFCVESGAAQAVDELLAYIAPRYPGCVLFFGLPAQNTAVAGHLQSLGFTLEEESFVDLLRFADYGSLPEPQGVFPVTRADFDDFAALHLVHDADMYWNNARILADLDRWRILLLREDGRPMGAIYYCFPNGGMMEIFGVDYPANRFSAKAFRTLLTAALNDGKRAGARHLYFFTDRDSHPVAAELGFRTISQYVLYVREI